MTIPSTAELLLEADRQRPRSQQTALGMSALGGCRRRAGYHLAGQPLDDKPSNSVQAVIGTAVHEAVTKTLREMRDDGLIPADSVIDEEVQFGGVIGHPDLYVRPLLRDTKTVGYQTQLDRFKANGPPRQHRWQVMTYGAALIIRGLPVEVVQLDYIARDSGNTWMWEAPFSFDDVADAMRWLDNVRETPLDMLARDYAPDSLFCQNCPFSLTCWDGHTLNRDERSVLLVTDEDAVRYAMLLEDARERKKAAENDEALAKGALDALRPNDRAPSRGEVRLEGFGKILRWTVGEDRRLDGDQVRADYARGGGVAPVTKGIKVKLELVAPPAVEE